MLQNTSPDTPGSTVTTKPPKGQPRTNTVGVGFVQVETGNNKQCVCCGAEQTNSNDIYNCTLWNKPIETGKAVFFSVMFCFACSKDVYKLGLKKFLDKNYYVKKHLRERGWK